VPEIAHGTSAQLDGTFSQLHAPFTNNLRRTPVTIPLAYHVDEAAKAVGIGRTKLYEAIRMGSLTAKKVGGRTIIPADALQSFLTSLPDMPSRSDR